VSGRGLRHSRRLLRGRLIDARHHAVANEEISQLETAAVSETTVSDNFRFSAAVTELSRLGRFSTLLVDPPWRFANRTGKMAPEHKRLSRYRTMTFEEIMTLPIEKLTLPIPHLYLWCPNALLPHGLEVMKDGGSLTNQIWSGIRCAKMVVPMVAAWGFTSAMSLS
jgi:hypothetical protein